MDVKVLLLGMEKYEPTPEEVEKAEDIAVEGEMTPEQEKMSKKREKLYNEVSDVLEESVKPYKESFDRLSRIIEDQEIKKGDKVTITLIGGKKYLPELDVKFDILYKNSLTIKWNPEKDVYLSSPLDREYVKGRSGAVISLNEINSIDKAE